MHRHLRRALAVLALGGALVSALRLVEDFGQKRESRQLYQAVQTRAVRPAETEPSRETVQSRTTRPIPAQTAPIAVDFNFLAQTNAETVGWLYCPETPIDLPVVQGTDNQQYLHRLFDGTPNNTGTLFVDSGNAGDFSNVITVLYGHNLKNGAMFGTLTRYKSPDYYGEHPTFWLLTPGGDYRVDLLAGCVVPADDSLYQVPHTDETARTLVSSAMEQSTFSSAEAPMDGDRFLLLSTCSYEFENARYVLLGRMTPCAGESTS